MRVISKPDFIPPPLRCSGTPSITPASPQGKALVAKSNRRTVRVAGDRESKRPSLAHSSSSKYSFGTGSGAGTSRTSHDGPGALQRGDEAAAPRCVMRYGVASGPVTAGVLQGKAPLFDIWGKTVNLASRLESTGVPGTIQVCLPGSGRSRGRGRGRGGG